MTAFPNSGIPKTIFVRAARLLLVGASGLALAAPLAANDLIFTNADARPVTGQRTDQRAGLTQIALTGGALVSIVDAAEYRINADGSVDLYEGTITVAAGPVGEVVVRMPEGLEGRVAGQGAAGNFAVRENGEASGHALTGMVRIGRAGALERFAAGQLWRVGREGRVRQVVANAAQVQPAAGGDGTLAADGDGRTGNFAVVPLGGDAGPVGAALNGIPTGLSDQLAGAGASSDIIAAARRIEAVVGNPAIETFPSGDFALLVTAAARLEGAFGGTPFPQAQADIIAAYLRFLAGGGAGSSFLASYSRFATDYLDLIRSGGLPSGFAATGPRDVEAYLAYIRRTGAFSALAARDRVLAEAYLAFLGSGGNRNAFARSFTDLTIAYFTFVRGGGDPATFTGANEASLAQTIAFLRDSGLTAQLTAADRALVEAYLANGGLAFAAQYRGALGDYFTFLASGRRPSEYTALDQATLRAYLETLASTGLFASVLGERAGFYTEYLAFLRSGGAVDGFAGLPANIFAGYAAGLDAYFVFLSSGRLPSEFAGTDIATLQAWLLQLQAAGALERFLGERAAFFAQYAAFVAGGGNVDAFAGLPANIFAGYATDLRTYYQFLIAGGVPSAYTLLTAEQIRAYIAALDAAGATAGALGDLAAFYREFAIYLAGGGNPDLYAGLPVTPDFPAFAAALNAYALFLQGGGLPSAYTAEDLVRLRGYIDALTRSGQLASLLGANADLLTGYFTHLAGGGSPDTFAGLPIYADYVAALNAYYAFLAGGGVPSGYTGIDPATIEAYLAALARLQGGLAGLEGLNAFFVEYFTFIAGGGNPDLFAGLPGGGGGGGTPTLLPQLAGAQFLRSFPGGAAVTSGTSASVTDDGQITNITIGADSLPLPGGVTGPYDQRALALEAAGRFGNTVAFTSYRDPSPSRGSNFVTHMIAGVPTAVLPQSGLVAYRLLGGGAPTEQGLASGSEGYFTGNLAVAFGQAQPMIGMDFTVASGGTTYASGTPGGAQDPMDGGMVYANGRFTGAFAASATAGTGCTRANACASTVIGSLFGEGTSHVGLVYSLNDDSTANAPRLISGSAIFGREGTALAGIGTAPDTGGGTGSGSRLTSYLGGFPAGTGRAYATDAGNSQPGSQPAVIAANGALQSAGNLASGTATAVEVAGDNRALLGRFAGGTATFRGGGNTYGVNGGLPYVVMAPMLGSLPVSGQIDYAVLAATNPIFTSGETAPGTFDGSLSIRFGAQLQYRTAGSITMPEQSGNVIYNFASTGYDQGTFQNVIVAGPGPADLFLQANVTGNGRGCAGSGCNMSFYGGFGGASPEERLGLVYQIFPGTFSLPRIQGSVIYAPVAAASSTAPVPGVSMARDVMPVPATATAPVLPSDWSRWSAPGRAVDGGAAAGGLAGMAVLPASAAPGMASGGGSASPYERSAMIREAQRMMGGMITFPGAASPER